MSHNVIENHMYSVELKPKPEEFASRRATNDRAWLMLNNMSDMSFGLTETERARKLNTTGAVWCNIIRLGCGYGFITQTRALRAAKKVYIK